MHFIEELILPGITPDNVLEVVQAELDKREDNKFLLDPKIRIETETVGAFTPERVSPREFYGATAEEYIVQICFPTDLVGGMTCIDGQIYTGQAILFRKDLPYERFTILKGTQTIVQINVLVMAKNQSPDDIRYIDVYGIKYAVPARVADVAKFAKSPAMFELMYKVMCKMPLDIREMYDDDNNIILEYYSIFPHLGISYSDLPITITPHDLPKLVGYSDTFEPMQMGLGKPEPVEKPLFIILDPMDMNNINPSHFHQRYVPFYLRFKSGMNEIVRRTPGVISTDAIMFHNELCMASFGHYGEVHYEITYTPIISEFGAEYAKSVPELSYRKISTDATYEPKLKHEMFYIDDGDNLRFSEQEAENFIEYVNRMNLIEEIRKQATRNSTKLNEISNWEFIDYKGPMYGYTEKDFPSICVLNVSGYICL